MSIIASAALEVWNDLQKEASLFYGRSSPDTALHFSSTSGEDVVEISRLLSDFVLRSSSFSESASRMLATELFTISRHSTTLSSASSSTCNCCDRVNSCYSRSWQRLLQQVLETSLSHNEGGQSTIEAVALDLRAVLDRDPACSSLMTAFLFFKVNKLFFA